MGDVAGCESPDRGGGSHPRRESTMADRERGIQHAEEQWPEPGTRLQPQVLGVLLLPVTDCPPVVATGGEGKPAFAPGAGARPAECPGALRLVEEHGTAVVGAIHADVAVRPRLSRSPLDGVVAVGGLVEKRIEGAFGSEPSER